MMACMAGRHGTRRTCLHAVQTQSASASRHPASSDVPPPLPTTMAAARSVLRLLPRSSLRGASRPVAVLGGSQPLHTSACLARPAGKGDQGA